MSTDSIAKAPPETTTGELIQPAVIAYLSAQAHFSLRTTVVIKPDSVLRNTILGEPANSSYSATDHAPHIYRVIAFMFVTADIRYPTFASSAASLSDTVSIFAILPIITST